MDKKRMVNELFWLLENNGETGCERISSFNVNLPDNTCNKFHIPADGKGNIVVDVFRSDTPSRLAVNNKSGVTIDWKDLDDGTCNQIYQIIKKVRSDEYNWLHDIKRNLLDVKDYLDDDMAAICDDDMLEEAEENMKRLQRALQMVDKLINKL